MSELITTSKGSNLISPELGRSKRQFGSGLSGAARNILESARDKTSTHKCTLTDIDIFKVWLRVTGVDLNERVIDVEDVINFLSDQHTGALSLYNGQKGTLLPGSQIAIATLKRRKSSIVKFLNISEMPLNHAENEILRQFFKSMDMAGEQDNPFGKRGQAAPIKRMELVAMMRSKTLKSKSQFVQLRDKAIIALMFAAGARESEILGENGIRLCDLTIKKDRIDYVRMDLKKKNRIRSHRGSIGKLSGKVSKKTVCIYSAIKEYVNYVTKECNLGRSDLIFIKATKGGQPVKSNAPIGPSSIENILANMLQGCSFPIEYNEMVSGHSLRVGRACQMAEDNESLINISGVTGQSLKTIERYIQQHVKQTTTGGF